MHRSAAKDAVRRQGRRELQPLPDAERWNHNIHYHPNILRVVPAGAARALDVGCGDGMLTRQLAATVGLAIGLDVDAPSLGLAPAETPAPNIAYVRGDVLTHPFVPGSFDVILSVAALHHMDTAAGLLRMAELLRPGGALGIVGLGRPKLPADLFHEVAGAVVTRLHQRPKTQWTVSSPMVWPPPDTYAQVRRTAAALLPGSEFRRHVLWRYTLTWSKPAA
jgi:SAM-dependent methyltransferase